MAIQKDNAQGGLSGGTGLMNGSVFKSAPFKIVAGYLSGGAAGAGGALLSSKNPNAGAALSAFGSGSGGTNGENTTMPDGSVAGPSNNFGAQSFQIPQGDSMGAMNRRLAGMGYGQNNGY